MPERFQDIVPQPIPVQKIALDGLQRLIFGLMVLLLGVVTALLVVVGTLNTQLNDVQDSQASGRERGLKIRAVSCQALAYVVITDDLPDVCLEPEVLEYYDPEREVTPEVGG